MNIRKYSALAVVLLLLGACSLAVAQLQAPKNQVVLLWPDGAPGSEGKSGQETVRISSEGDHVLSGVHQPSITLYLPAKERATGAGIVIIPGGGHRELWMDH